LSESCISRHSMHRFLSHSTKQSITQAQSIHRHPATPHQHHHRFVSYPIIVDCCSHSGMEEDHHHHQQQQQQQLEGGQVAHDKGDANSARPRRADAETLTYLRSLEPLIDQSVKALDAAARQQQQGGRGRARGEEEEAEEEGEEVAEDRALLVSNLIDELTYKVRWGRAWCLCVCIQVR
jgi:hypothetical protein